MKRLFVLLSLLFCGFAFADTITINWGVDNQPYTTTTCTVGGDVTLPSVSKRGHVFRGWQAEHFDRGTFADWADVPSSKESYSLDYHGKRSPLHGDYITIKDASAYKGTYDNPIYIRIVTSGYGRQEWTLSIDDGVSFNVSRGYTPRDIITKQYNDFELEFRGTTDILYVYSSVFIKYNGTIFSPGQPILYFDYNAPRGSEYVIYFSSDETVYSGTWRFKYDGIWENDGKNGWKPDVQISNE